MNGPEYMYKKKKKMHKIGIKRILLLESKPSLRLTYP